MTTTIKVNPSAVIDVLTGYLDALQEYESSSARQDQRGSGDQAMQYHKKADEIHSRLFEASIFLNMRGCDVYALARIVRKWNENTNWRLCLADATLSRLLDYYQDKGHLVDHLAQKRPGTYAEWSERSRRWRVAQ